MSRKTSPDSANGFGDIIGIALLAVALLLLVAQLSFDSNDVSFLTTKLNKPTNNWIGPLGAYLAWASFIPFGLVAYLLPVLFTAFGLSYLLNFPRHLREHLRWSSVWSVTLLVSLTGLLFIMDDGGRAEISMKPSGPRATAAAGICNLRTDATLQLRLLPAGHRRCSHCLPGAVPHQPAVPDEFPARRMDSRFH